MADITYPASEITPAGWWHLVNDTRPTMRLRAYDGSIEFYVAGGYAPPFHDDHTAPEAVALVDLKGLIPPWKHITQKGATQDGDTWVDALYNRTDVQIVVDCIGRDPKHVRQVMRDLIASIDAKQPATLDFITQDMGHWWAPLRWWDTPPDPLANLAARRQRLSLRLSADDAFWRSYDDVGMFTFPHNDMADGFDVDHYGVGNYNLGTNWPQRYSGAGAGYCYSRDGLARWLDSGTTAYEVVNGPYKDFVTATDNQVISITLGSFPDLTVGSGAYVGLLGRMNKDGGGNWNGSGVAAWIGVNGRHGWVRLSRYSGFTETVMVERSMFPPRIGDTYTLLCGAATDPRQFQILRNRLPILRHKEIGTNSPVGSGYRGVGFGMHAAAGTPTQTTPPNIAQINAGDNITGSGSGFIAATNIGDQPMYRDWTCFGPGTFRIYDGPGSGDYIEFGPLLPNQIAFLRSDPRTNTTLVQDLTVIPPTPQEINIFQQIVKSIISFFSSENAFTEQVESMFGIRAPQGPMYSLLKGRFSDASAIPPKSAGRPAAPYYVRVEIDGGNADSKIISAGTPLRRYPL